ncbi:MAG: hypothetical protein ABSH49_06720 [Bryobacteraceae bacterium]
MIVVFHAEYFLLDLPPPRMRLAGVRLVLEATNHPSQFPFPGFHDLLYESLAGAEDPGQLSHHCLNVNIAVTLHGQLHLTLEVAGGFKS